MSRSALDPSRRLRLDQTRRRNHQVTPSDAQTHLDGAALVCALAMPDGPYRPDPTPPDAELARLAAEGERRIQEASTRRTAAQQGAGERNRARNIRVALGGYYGSPVGKASVALIVVGATMLVGEIAWDIHDFALGGLIFVWAVMLRVFVRPKATRARVEAEKAWTRSLPFGLDGYFEALGAAAQLSCKLTVTLAWIDPGLAADDGTLHGLVGLLDTDARVVSREAGSAVIQSGRIEDRTRTRIQVNRATHYVRRNTPLVRYVHALVEQVLLPLHRAHPIARVTLERG